MWQKTVYHNWSLYSYLLSKQHMVSGPTRLLACTPLIRILYGLNGLPLAVKEKTLLFPDDSPIFIKAITKEEVSRKTNIDLELALNWFTQNSLTVQYMGGKQISLFLTTLNGMTIITKY